MVRHALLWAGIAFLALGLAAVGCRGPKAYYDRGDEAFAAGDFDAAIADYEQALALEPASAEGLNRLGMAYREKYNTARIFSWKEKEIGAFTRSVTMDSLYWPARVNLGASLYYLGRKTEAAPHFRRALELNPDNPEREKIEGMIAEGEEESLLSGQ
jgi:superkiller protein 3